MKSTLILSLIMSGGGVAGWEFPPKAAYTPHQHPMSDGEEDVDIITGSQFRGLKTFGNLPYVNCFIDAEAETKPYDIAILGAPFDTVPTPC
jgi:agmatinase